MVVTRQTEPLNFEFLFPTLSSFLTPNEQFYLRTHFQVPNLTAAQWKLKIFEYDWQVPNRPGNVTLLSRANNERGAVQPMQRDTDHRDAVSTHVQPFEVFVR